MSNTRNEEIYKVKLQLEKLRDMRASGISEIKDADSELKLESGHSIDAAIKAWELRLTGLRGRRRPMALAVSVNRGY